MKSGHAAIELLQADFSAQHDVDQLCAKIREERPYHLTFTLGLTCLPDWRSFSAQVIESAPAGARVTIMDVYSEKLTLGAQLINWIGAADCERRVWEELERATSLFEWTEYRPFGVLDVSVFVARGTKVG